MTAALCTGMYDFAGLWVCAGMHACAHVHGYICVAVCVCVLPVCVCENVRVLIVFSLYCFVFKLTSLNMSGKKHRSLGICLCLFQLVHDSLSLCMPEDSPLPQRSVSQTQNVNTSTFDH